MGKESTGSLPGTESSAVALGSLEQYGSSVGGELPTHRGGLVGIAGGQWRMRWTIGLYLE